jgi:hypothetical protein
MLTKLFYHVKKIIVPTPYVLHPALLIKIERLLVCHMAKHPSYRCTARFPMKPVGLKGKELSGAGSGPPLLKGGAGGFRKCLKILLNPPF